MRSVLWVYCGPTSPLHTQIPQTCTLAVCTRNPEIGRQPDVCDPAVYPGGEEDWIVHCDCGTTDDDGERMVACERCNQWRHTRCLGAYSRAWLSAIPPV